MLNELKRIYGGLSLIKDLPAKTLGVIVSFGERMSSVIVAAMIDGAERRDSLNFIKTEKWFDKNIADQKLTTQLVIEEFQTPFNKAIVRDSLPLTKTQVKSPLSEEVEATSPAHSSLPPWKRKSRKYGQTSAAL